MFLQPIGDEIVARPEYRPDESHRALARPRVDRLEIAWLDGLHNRLRCVEGLPHVNRIPYPGARREWSGGSSAGKRCVGTRPSGRAEAVRRLGREDRCGHALPSSARIPSFSAKGSSLLALWACRELRLDSTRVQTLLDGVPRRTSASRNLAKRQLLPQCHPANDV